ELLKDYDYQILYHLGKANVVANALSRKSVGSLAHVSMQKRILTKELNDLFDMGVRFEISDAQGLIAHFQVKPKLINEIGVAQDKDPDLIKIKEEVQIGNAPGCCWVKV